MRVVKISKEICNIFVKEKHYSRKLGIFWEGFALVEGEENKITGMYCRVWPTITTNSKICFY